MVLAISSQAIIANSSQPTLANAPATDFLTHTYTPLGCMPLTLVVCGMASTE